MFEIAIDTGGTFTDGVMVDESGRTYTAKVPSNVVDPSTSMMECMTLLAHECGLTDKKLITDTKTIVIGSTITTNAVVERKGAKCCMLYTRGFRDTLELSRRIAKENPYDLRVPPPEFLIPRYLRFGIEERIGYDGQIITPLNEDDVRDAVSKAKEQGVEVPIICFLHSYNNSEHEERAAAIVKAEYPNVVMSSHILRRRMEGYRFHTAVLAGYVKPLVVNFVRQLEQGLKDVGFKGTLLFVTCAGGVAVPQLCEQNPVLMMGSGPAAGPLFAHLLGELAGFENIMSLDVGGTSADLCILPEGKIKTTTESIIAGHRNGIESVDVTSIGCGGGSIAWLDPRGILHVGPESAGADPGPACYGKGGQQPTLTDADVLLGYIPYDYFLGGAIPLDVSLAEKTIKGKIAEPLGISLIEAADAISQLAEENMARETFLWAVKKGLDPRDFVLVMAGGNGPVHAALAGRLGIEKIYIPKQAAVFCPTGILLADYKYILSRFYYRSGKEIDPRELNVLYRSLEKEGVDILKNQGIAQKDIKIVRGAGVRYYGQLYDIEILLPDSAIAEPFTSETLRLLIDGFHEQHEAVYGRSDPSMPVTIETIKLHAIGKRHPPEITKEPMHEQDPSTAFKRNRQVYFKQNGGFNETPCYDGERLRRGNVIMGPAIIEETKTTVVIPPQYKLAVDVYGNYMMRRC